MYKYEAKAGEKYGRLTLIKETVCTSKKHMWLCKCDCGKLVEVSIYQLKNGECKSCGCLRDEVATQRCYDMAKHNMALTRIYKLWGGMLGRCNNPNNKDFPKYGGRGIKVCDEWHDFVNFNNWANENGYSDELSIDRIDVNGNYEPNNCRWVTLAEQARNKRNNHFVEYNGETRCLKEWSRIIGKPYSTIHRRLKIGWTTERAFEQPIRGHHG